MRNDDDKEKDYGEQPSSDTQTSNDESTLDDQSVEENVELMQETMDSPEEPMENQENDESILDDQPVEENIERTQETTDSPEESLENQDNTETSHISEETPTFQLESEPESLSVSQSMDDILAQSWEQSLTDTASIASKIDLDAFLNDDQPASYGMRDLDQNEIDNLLGFDNQSKTKKAETGINAILNKTLIYYERLPMMEVVFDRLLRLLSTSLRNFTSDNVEISLESMKSFRFGDFLNSISLPAMIGVFKAVEWDNQGIVVVDSSLIYSIVDVLLGGRRSITAPRVEGRPYTTIERNLIEKMMNVVLDDLKTAFEPVSPITFHFERLEINPHFAMISRATNAGIVVRLHVEIDDRGGRMSLMLPYATIEPIRELLLQNFMGEKFGRDSIWEQHLAKELWETEVEFEIHMAHTVATLGETLKWKPGDQVHFAITPSSMVSAISGEYPLFEGLVGQKNGRVAIRVEKNFIQENLSRKKVSKKQSFIPRP